MIIGNHPSLILSPLQIALLAVQSAILAVVLLASILVPRAGQPALLLPISGTASQHSLAWIRAHHGDVIGRGLFSGSYIIHSASILFAGDAMSSGFLLLRVPARFCGSQDEQKQVRQVTMVKSR